MGQVLKTYVTARVVEGTTTGSPVVKRYGVRAFPTLLVLDAQGEVVDEIHAEGPEHLVEELNRVAAGKDTLQVLRKEQASAPDDLALLLKLAERIAMRSPTQARKLFERAEGLSAKATREERARTLMGMAGTQGDEGQYAAALAGYLRVIQEYPDSRVAGLAPQMASNWLYMAPVEEGLAWVTTARPLVAADAREFLDHARDQLYRRGADEALLRAGKAADEDVDLLNYYAWECFLRNVHTEEATAWARRAVELSERAPYVLDTLANLLARAGHLDEAIALEAEAVKSAPNDEQRLDFEESAAKFRAVRDLRAARAATPR